MVSSRLTRYRQTPGESAKTVRGYAICTVDVTEPTNPHDGDMWLDTANTRLKVYDRDAASWIEIPVGKHEVVLLAAGTPVDF